MKTTRQLTETIEHGNEIVIQDLKINNFLSEEFPSAEYELKIQNSDGRLLLEFYHKEKERSRPCGVFSIHIREGKMYFHRHLYRPNHDHDDHLSLVFKEEPKTQGKGMFAPRLPREEILPKELMWTSSSVHYDEFYVPFGPDKASY